jgi:predicted deacylase
MPAMQPYAIGDLSAAPGEIVHGWFELAALPTGLVERLPLTIVHGSAPGPVLWLTANIHGDEVTGLAVVHAVVPGLLAAGLRGTVVAIPTLNPLGLHARRRESFLDRRDPNRLFPDFPPLPGVLPESPAVLEVGYARLFAAARRADLLVDLHCYGFRASCFVIRDRVLYRRDEERRAALDLARRLEALCTWTGLPVVNEVPARRYVDSRLHRSVSGAALLQAKIPAITVELGLTGAVDPPALAAGVAAVRNVLRGAGMLPGEPEPTGAVPQPRPPYPVMRDLVPKARSSGILHYCVEPGATVRAGDRLATMTDLHGRPLAGGGEILAEHDGWILSLPRGAICFEGEAVVHMAVRDDSPLVELDPAAGGA